MLSRPRTAAWGIFLPEWSGMCSEAAATTGNNGCIHSPTGAELGMGWGGGVAKKKLSREQAGWTPLEKKPVVQALLGALLADH